MRLFFKYATQRATLRRSVRVAVPVGTILAAINHYDTIGFMVPKSLNL